MAFALMCSAVDWSTQDAETIQRVVDQIDKLYDRGVLNESLFAVLQRNVRAPAALALRDRLNQARGEKALVALANAGAGASTAAVASLRGRYSFTVVPCPTSL